MKTFNDIAKIVFNKSPISLQGVEESAATSLREISLRFENKEIAKEQATTEKLRLNERYDLACLHWSTLNDITQFVVNGIWSAENTIEFAQFVASELMMLCRKVSNSEELIPYSDIIVVADRIVEKRMREAANEKREDGTKRNESREPYQMGIDT